MLPSLSMPEMLVIMLVAVILFGKRLPEVGRSLGKGLVEFKKGLRGFEDEFQSATTPRSTVDRYDDHRTSDVVEPTVPKFELPPATPAPQPEPEPQPYHD